MIGMVVGPEAPVRVRPDRLTRGLGPPGRIAPPEASQALITGPFASVNHAIADAIKRTTPADSVPSRKPGAVCRKCRPPRRERKFDRGSTLGVDGLSAKILNEVRRYRPGMNYCAHILKATTSA